MTKRIFHAICLASICIFLVSSVLFMGTLYVHFTGEQQEQLQMQTRLAAQGVAHEGADYFVGLDIQDHRITWIDADGTVLYDSRSTSAEMENHLQRKEVKDALAQGIGESIRYSDTLLERSLYCAQKLDDGTVIRLSVPQSAALSLVIGMIQPTCVIFGIILVLAFVLASRLSKKIAETTDASVIGRKQSVPAAAQTASVSGSPDDQNSYHP